MSRPFRLFFEKLKKQYPDQIGDILIEDVANLIIAKPRDSIYGFEADIVSGPIDADKLDYFPRDGRAVGVQISLDIERLINCVEIQETEISGKKRNSLVINRRGYNSLQQLLFARASLTASVYHHHKVRSCDSMLKNVLNFYIEKPLNFKCCKLNPSGLSLNDTPNYLLITDNDFQYEINNQDIGTIPHELLNNLFNRTLFKRVLKISLTTITTERERDVQQSQDEIGAEFSQFTNFRTKAFLRKKMIAEICIRSGIEKHLFSIDIPHKPNFEKAGNAPINYSSDGNPAKIVTLKNIVPIEEWIKGYERYFGHTYIFGIPDNETRKNLAIATAEILSEGKDFPELKLTTESIAEDIKSIVLSDTKGRTLFRDP